MCACVSVNKYTWFHAKQIGITVFAKEWTQYHLYKRVNYMHTKESLLSCVLSGQMSKDREDQKDNNL